MLYSLPGLRALAPASLLLLSSTIIVDAAIVDAATLTGVSVDTSYFDNQTGDCGSDGCYGALTRVRCSATPLLGFYFMPRKNELGARPWVGVGVGTLSSCSSCIALLVELYTPRYRGSLFTCIVEYS